MRVNVLRIFLLAAVIFVLFTTSSNAQKIGYISSQTIRERFPEAQASQQRVQSMVDDWKRELETMSATITNLENDIRKNRLIWSDQERTDKDAELVKKKKDRDDFAKRKFDPNGEYDNAVNSIVRPLEEKIYAAVQEASQEEGVDLVWDKTTQPLVYVNPKYDLTVKVLKKLGIEAADLEKKQEEAIQKDPNNKEKEVKTPPSRRSRSKKAEETEPTKEPSEGGQNEPVAPPSPMNSPK